MTVGSDLLRRYSGAMIQVFGQPQLVLASGHGCWVTDVDGNGPGEGSAFSEGSRAISVGLDATLNNTYNASLAYTNYMDGDYGTRGDRDFVSISLGVNF